MKRSFAFKRAVAAPLAVLLGPATAVVARAEVYMTDAQAAAAIFPGARFERKTLALDDADAKAVRAASGQTVRARGVVYWRAPAGEVVFIDQVLGKHEFITYAVGVSSVGTVAGVEVLEYRETYGSQVCQAEWLSQFVGKDASARLKLDDDVRNISGATLSSAHLTAGVKRLLCTYDRVRSRL
jgi:Na+-translocating ferredoxin:NAD+ oxidoreductase RnfG subunit